MISYLSLNKTHLLKHIKKILKVAVYATIYCFLVFVLIYNRDFLTEIEHLCKITTWYSFLVFNEPIYGFHLWYLWSILYVLIFLYFIPSEILRNKKWMLGSILLLFLIYSIYSVRFFILNALPFVLTGIFISQNMNFFYTSKVKIICFALLFMFLGYAIWNHEILFLNYSYFSIPVFILMLILPFKGRLASCLAWCGRNCSLGIYIFHPLVLTLLKKFLGEKIFPFLNAVVTMVLLVFLISICLFIKKRLCLRK